MGIVYCMSALVIFISYKILYLDGGHRRYENLYSKNPNEFYSQPLLCSSALVSYMYGA